MHQSQQILSPTLSFDLESPTTMSLPSPGATSCSLDGPLEGGAMSPPANVSRRRDSTSSEAPALQGRVNVLHRVSRWFDYGKQGFLIHDHIDTNGNNKIITSNTKTLFEKCFCKINKFSI